MAARREGVRVRTIVLAHQTAWLQRVEKLRGDPNHYLKASRPRRLRNDPVAVAAMFDRIIKRQTAEG